MLDLTDWQNRLYTTELGWPVQLLAYDSTLEAECLVGIATKPNRNKILLSWHEGGSFLAGGWKSGNDLINAKTKNEGWVNVYGRDCDYTYILSRTEKEANDNASIINRVACIHIEWEE